MTPNSSGSSGTDRGSSRSRPPHVEVLATADPERFTVLLGGGRVHTATLAHDTRRALAPAGTAPVTVARELVLLIIENDRWPESDDEVALAAVAGSLPSGYVDELRARLG